MSKWARIENGIVQEVTGINPVSRFVAKLAKQFVSCNDAVQQGYKYADGVFEAPSELEPEQPPQQPYEYADPAVIALGIAVAAQEERLTALEGGAKA